jgi:phage tail tape-measure protein
VRAFAEQIVAASYQTCAPLTGPGSYGNNGAMVNPPSGFSVTITKIEYGDALSSSGGTQTFSTTNQGACIAAGDAGVERITIVATPVSGPGAATLQIVKRNPIETS